MEKMVELGGLLEDKQVGVLMSVIYNVSITAI